MTIKAHHGIVLALGAFVAASAVCEATSQPVTAVPALTVTVTRPVRVEWPELVVASGSIEPWQEAVVGAQLGGQRIAAVLAEVGDVVRAGQLLARLNTEALDAEQAELQAALVQAEAARDQAFADRERAEQLRGRGALSEQEILRIVTQADVAEAQVGVAAARLQSQRLRVRYAQITAPDDGVVTARSATLGAVTQVGEELFRIIRQGRLEWRGELTAEQLGRIRAAARVELELPDGNRAGAVVRAVAPALTGGSRLGLAYADIEEGSTARAGMYAEGRILLDASPALVVPAASVVVRDGRSVVFALTEAETDNTARIAARAVTAGRREGNLVEILAGLAATDRVVEQGAGFLNDGDLVRIVGGPMIPSGDAP